MELILVNQSGKELDLLNNDNYFVISKCENLHGLETDISTLESPYLDGAQVEMVRALPRGISMTFTLIPDIRGAIDFFTSYVKTKQVVTLIEREKGREIQIKGIATIPPYTRMLASCKIDLEIYCGAPYWEDLKTIVAEISQTIAKLFFPVDTGQYFTLTGRVFSIVDLEMERTFENIGDVSVGMNIKLTAISSVTNPRISCSSGSQNGWYMQLNLTLNANDEVEINTERGNKYIKINGSETYNGQPVLSYLTFVGTDWLQLEVGKNTFNVSASAGESRMYFTISYKARYE